MIQRQMFQMKSLWTSTRRLQVDSEEDAQPNRFLLLLVKGKLIGAQQISLGANVDCHSDEKEI